VSEVVNHYIHDTDKAKFNTSLHYYHRALTDAVELSRLAMRKFKV